ncbi:hypothetical protein [Streptomyces sp. NPDC005009]
MTDSRRFSALLHRFQGGPLTITGGTRTTSGSTMFVNKADTSTVASSQGARLIAGNGVLFQPMAPDGPIVVSGLFDNSGENSD